MNKDILNKLLKLKMIQASSFKSGGITAWIVKIDDYGIGINIIVHRLQARPGL